MMKQCESCDGRGVEWGETCLTCGGAGEVTACCGSITDADGLCFVCDAEVKS